MLFRSGTCCGGSNLDYVSPKHFALVNGRNIALAEKMGLDLIVSCNTCLMTIRTAKKKLDESPELKKEINELLLKSHQPEKYNIHQS